MISRPTTEQLLIDCARELMEGVLPALTDPTAIVRLAMVEQVLRNAAVRSAKEISWMTGEIPSLRAYAAEVLAAEPDAALTAACASFDQQPDTGLELDAVVDRYVMASTLFADALELAISRGHVELRERGEALVVARLERETTIMAGWNPTGR